MTDPKFSRRFMLQAGAAACIGTSAFGQASERQIEGGIGGTGIVGLLTDFGSLIINGTYVNTDSQTVFSDNFGRVRETDLRLGDSLTIEAASVGSALIARRVHLSHPVVGKISAIERGGRLVVVNDVKVVLPARLRGFGIGDAVAISGIWRGTHVIASGLISARSRSDALAGVVTRSRQGTFVGPVRVRGSGTASAASGSFLTALGSFDGTEFQANRTTGGRFTGAAGALKKLSVEGYLEPTNSAPGFRVAGLGHSFARNLSLNRYAKTRALFDGPYTDTFAPDRATVLPEERAARERVLRRILDRK